MHPSTQKSNTTDTREERRDVRQPAGRYIAVSYFRRLVTDLMHFSVQVPSATIDFGTVWITILWGGVGGWFGAIYNLWAHVSRDQDYDPQFALWYYTNPVIGLILGALVYVVIRTGIVVAAGTEIQPAPYVTYGMYVLAWAVGFQQNLALSLVNSVLKKLIPQDEKGGKASTPQPPGSASVGGSPPNPPK